MKQETQRGYSWLQIRSVNEEERIIEGIATTPTVARDGDIIETKGIKFRLPIPFLYRHKDPFGNVVAANVSDGGIAVTIKVAPAGTSVATDEQWRLVKTGTVRGLSIGWKTLKEKFDKAIGGFRILESDWMELSAVPVGADPNALITAVRSASEAILKDADRTPIKTSPGVSGSTKGKAMKSLKERIAALEQKRSGLQTDMKTIDDRMTADGREQMNAEESAEYDPLATEKRGLDAQINRLRAMDDEAGTAKEVVAVVDGERLPTRRAYTESVKKVELPKGTMFTRSVIALVRAGGNHFSAAQMAQHYYKDTPEVALYLRSIVDAGDTQNATWAAPLVSNPVSTEFIEMLRPATLIGRIPNLTRVPFNVKAPIGTGDGTFRWVGESANKPVGAMSFDSKTLYWAKAAGITVISDELARFSSPAAEPLIGGQMVKGCVKFLDSQFVDENIAAVSNVSPASILNGKSAVAAASGTTAAHFRVDLNKLYAAFLTANQDPTGAVILMSSTSAMALGAMMNALGQQEFPNLTMTGGSLNGVPVVCSEAVGNRLILLNAKDILFADDGGVRVDVSREASIEMNTLPITGESSPIDNATIHSMFQRNEIAIRVERMINWVKARTSSAEWISGCAYVPSA